jgi:hypothetical protein
LEKISTPPPLNMPKAFDSCVKRGGRVRTVKPSKNKYMRICFLGGKSYASHMKRTKRAKSAKKKAAVTAEAKRRAAQRRAKSIKEKK